MSNVLKRGVRIGILALTCGLLTTLPGRAHWISPTEIPVERLLKNMRAYIEAHPKDARAYYTLGRINSAAFAEDTNTVGVYGSDISEDKLPNVSPTHRYNEKPPSPEALTYLADAILNYKKAAHIDPFDIEYSMGLGFQCQEALPYPTAIARACEALALPGKPGKEKLRVQALGYYRQAYHVAILQDKGDLDYLSAEAAEAILNLEKGHKLSAQERTENVKITKLLAAYYKRPRPITPILISFRPKASLSDLLSPETHVRFDLAGDGLGKQWPWVKPTTGILVWDPKHTGKITSGLQLFGSVTWWLFWKDGYEPLAALDNNHNGWLEGAELEGIAVWFDNNSNGIADKGEVVPLSSLGVKRIATHSAGLADGVPANADGVQLQDGSTLPTFDWTPTSLKPAIR